MRHLIVRGPVRIESCCVQIIQFVEFNGDCKASIQSVPFLQEVLHHPDVRARKDKLDIRESVVDDVLENGVNRCRVSRLFEIGVFVNNHHYFFRQGIKINKHILQGAEVQRNRQHFDSDQFPYKAVNIILHCAF